MIDHRLFESRPDNGLNKSYTLAISTILHSVIVGTLIVVPLIQMQAMPPAAPPPPLRISGPRARTVQIADTPHAANRVAAAAHVLTVPQVDSQIAPEAMPPDIAVLGESFETAAGDPASGSNLIASGVGPGGAIGISAPVMPRLAPPPAAEPVPPPSPKIEIRQPVRVSSTLQKSHLIQQIDPAYPPLARIARIEGAVVLEARITGSGMIDNLRVISGNPLLIPSVLDAVRQWRYEPTILNGTAVDVITTITVNFTLR